MLQSNLEVFNNNINKSISLSNLKLPQINMLNLKSINKIKNRSFKNKFIKLKQTHKKNEISYRRNVQIFKSVKKTKNKSLRTKFIKLKQTQMKRKRKRKRNLPQDQHLLHSQTKALELRKNKTLTFKHNYSNTKNKRSIQLLQITSIRERLKIKISITSINDRNIL